MNKYEELGLLIIKVISFFVSVAFLSVAYNDSKCDIKTFNLLLFMFGIFFLKVIFVGKDKK